jgi:hypothetical protein
VAFLVTGGTTSVENLKGTQKICALTALYLYNP